MASERSKRRDLLALSFITKSISKKLLIKIYQTVCEKMTIHSLICPLRFLLLTTCSVIVQTFSTIWHFFGTEWPEDHKNKCLSSSTNRVELYFF